MPSPDASCFDASKDSDNVLFNFAVSPTGVVGGATLLAFLFSVVFFSRSRHAAVRLPQLLCMTAFPVRMDLQFQVLRHCYSLRRRPTRTAMHIGQTSTTAVTGGGVQVIVEAFTRTNDGLPECQS